MDIPMKELTVPELALIAITRVALGMGVGLLLGRRLSEGGRTAAGWSLLLVGIASTIPLAIDVFGRRACGSQPSSDLKAATT
jgi:hypothetical protein